MAITVVRKNIPVKYFMGNQIRASVGARLKEERERLGLSQTDFAALGGATKQTQIQWEKGTAVPNAEFLAVAAEHGLDVLYVVTGQRAAPVKAVEPIGARERALLENYGAASKETKRAIEKMALLAAHESTIEEKQPASKGRGSQKKTA